MSCFFNQKRYDFRGKPIQRFQGRKNLEIQIEGSSPSLYGCFITFYYRKFQTYIKIENNLLKPYETQQPSSIIKKLTVKQNTQTWNHDGKNASNRE